MDCAPKEIVNLLDISKDGRHLWRQLDAQADIHDLAALVKFAIEYNLTNT